MADLKQTLIQLNENLSILREREARYAGNAPVELLNQITDHEQAIALTEQARQGQLSEPDWREALRPLLVNIRDRGEQAPETCGVSIGDVDGGIIGSIIAGGNVSNVQVAHGSNIAQASHGGKASVNVTDQRGQQISGDQYNVAGDQHNYQVEKESPAWRRWSIIVGIVTIIGVIATVLAVPQFNAVVFPERTITSTPLPVTLATEGESLILIATFHETGANKTEPHVKIKRAIEDAAKEVGLDTLRVEIEPTILTADQREEVEALGELYNAEMVIWGEDTGVQILVNFYNLKQRDFDAAKVEISEELRTQIVNPNAYAEFVLRDLPGQLTFLAFFTIGQALISKEEYVTARDVIEGGISSLAPNSKPEGLADAYFRVGWLYSGPLADSRFSIDNYSKTIRVDPAYAAAFVNRGSEYAKLGEYEKGLDDFNQALDLKPNLVEALVGRGGVYLLQENYQTALSDLNKALNLDPEYFGAYFNRGTIYNNLQNYEAALADFNYAVELNPDYAANYTSRGIVYYALQDYGAALADYTRAIELNPEDAIAYNNRGSIYNILQNYEAALADFSRAIELNPDYAGTLTGRGIVYYALQDYGAALADYTRAIELNPEDTVAYNNRVSIYNNILQDYEKALADFSRVIELAPEDAGAYYNRGFNYLAQGKSEQAIVDFETGLQFDTDPASRQRAEKTLAQLKAQLAHPPETK